MATLATLGSVLRRFQVKGAWTEALTCLVAAKERGLQIAEVSVNRVLGAAGKSATWAAAFQLSRCLTQIRGSLCDPVTVSTLIHANRNHWKLAFDVLSKAESVSVPNIVCFNAALATLDVFSWPWALSALRAAKTSLDLIDVTAWNVVMSAMAKATQWQQALWLFGRMQFSHRLRPDVFSYGAGLHGCQLGAAWALALQLMEQMVPNDDLRPNVVAFTSALKSCIHRWPRVLQLLREAQERQRLKPSLLSYTAVLGAFTREERWSAALEVRELVKFQAIRRMDSIFTTQLLASCETSKKWRWAMAIFEELQVTVQMNFITYSSLMSSCTQAQQWQCSFVAYHKHGSSGGVCNSLTNAAISACSGSTQWLLAAVYLTKANAVNGTNGSTQILERKHSMEAMQVASIADLLGQQHWHQALWWFQLQTPKMVDCKMVESIEMAGCAAINACEKGNEWRASLQVLAALNLWMIPLGDQTFNSAIVACEKGEWKSSFFQ